MLTCTTGALKITVQNGLFVICKSMLMFNLFFAVSPIYEQSLNCTKRWLNRQFYSVKILHGYRIIRWRRSINEQKQIEYVRDYGVRCDSGGGKT